MKKIYSLIPDPGLGVSQGDQMLQYEELFDQVSDTDDNLTLAIRELLQNSIDPIDERSDIEKTKVRITLKKILYDFIDLSSFKKHLDLCINESKQSYKGDKYLNDKTYKSLQKIKSKLSNNQLQSETIIIEDISGGLSGSKRFNKEDGDGLDNLVGSNKSNKSEGGGSHGVGKTTAFNLSSINTVFYLNTYNGISRFIGKFIGNTYYDKEKGRQCGPNYFFGEKKISSGLTYGDFSIIDEPPSKLKQLKGDGLSTIIPIDNNVDSSNWTDKVIFSVITNYYRNFLDGNLEVEISNELDHNSNVIIINKKNLKTLYKGLESKKIIDKNHSTVNYHKYNMIKPQIIEESPVEIQKFNIDFKHSHKKFNSICKINFYKNIKLQEIYDDDEIQLQSYMKQNFRILRGNTLIRSHYLPGRPGYATSLTDYSYCGLVEFEGGFNSVIRALETQSHDKLNYKYIEGDTDFPSKRTILKIMTDITTKIRETVDRLSGNNVKNEEEFSVEFENMFDQESENESASYKRKLFSDDDVRRLINRNQSTLQNEGGNKINNGFTNAKIDQDGNIIYSTRRIGPPGPPPPPPPIPPDHRPDLETKQRGVQENNSPFKIKNHETVKGVSFRSYLKSSNQKFHNYLLEINGIDKCSSLEIMQDSILDNSLLSFDLKSLKVNGGDYNIEKIEISSLDGFPRSLLLRNIDSINNKIQLELSVEEIEKTVSEFKLNIS